MNPLLPVSFTSNRLAQPKATPITFGQFPILSPPSDTIRFGSLPTLNMSTAGDVNLQTKEGLDKLAKVYEQAFTRLFNQDCGEKGKGFYGIQLATALIDATKTFQSPNINRTMELSLYEALPVSVDDFRLEDKLGRKLREQNIYLEWKPLLTHNAYAIYTGLMKAVDTLINKASRNDFLLDPIVIDINQPILETLKQKASSSRDTSEWTDQKLWTRFILNNVNLFRAKLSGEKLTQLVNFDPLNLGY